MDKNIVDNQNDWVIKFIKDGIEFTFDLKWYKVTMDQDGGSTLCITLSNIDKRMIEVLLGIGILYDGELIYATGGLVLPSIISIELNINGAIIIHYREVRIISGIDWKNIVDGGEIDLEFYSKEEPQCWII